MKKCILLLLAAAFLLLCACGGGEEPAQELETMIVGQWQFDDGRSMIFRSDRTGSLLEADGEEARAFSWVYDPEQGCYSCSFPEGGEALPVGYIIQDGITTLHCGGSCGARVETE